MVGPDANVPVPQYCEKFDFELELAMVVGRRGKNIAEGGGRGATSPATRSGTISARAISR